MLFHGLNHKDIRWKERKKKKNFHDSISNNANKKAYNCKFSTLFLNIFKWFDTLFFYYLFFCICYVLQVFTLEKKNLHPQPSRKEKRKKKKNNV